MAKSFPFGARSTADKVLAGIDLTGKHFVVSGCNSGIGFETMNSLAANGAHVFGLARTFERAEVACRKAGPTCMPVACDLADFASIAVAAQTIRSYQNPLDAIVANAGIANPPQLQTRYGLELQFLVNHIGHFALVNALLDLVRNATGRIVIVSDSAGIRHAPREGIMFDNLDGHHAYQPSLFYGQSKLANALFAKELSRRLASRGIAVNSLHPGATRATGLRKNLSLMPRLASAVKQWFMRSSPRGAATQALLAANPSVSGITGEHWFNCQITAGHLLLEDAQLAQRLWAVSEQIVTHHCCAPAKPLREAA